jgi:hypothetical protein
LIVHTMRGCKEIAVSLDGYGLASSG